jgi:hypothetical protein
VAVAVEIQGHQFGHLLAYPLLLQCGVKLRYFSVSNNEMKVWMHPSIVMSW